jgi:FMN reductase
MQSVVAISGSLTKPSRTRNLVSLIGQEIAAKTGAEFDLIDIADLLPTLLSATSFDKLPQALQDTHRQLASADLIVIGSPVYKGSYSGLLKHYLDLLNPTLLAGKAAVLAATGGSDRHALVIEHQLRPLASFFELHTVPFGVYARDTDFVDYRLTSESTRARVDETVTQSLRLLGQLGRLERPQLQLVAS